MRIFADMYTYKRIADKARLKGRAPAPAIVYFPKHEVLRALGESENLGHACMLLGLANKSKNGRAIRHLREIADFHEIDITYYVVSGASESRKAPRITEEELVRDVLILNGRKSHSRQVKKWLFDFGLKERICEECGIDEQWNNRRLTLELHHRNGNPLDNRIENLEIVCPNCHSQTDTYKSKNLTKMGV